MKRLFTGLVLCASLTVNPLLSSSAMAVLPWQDSQEQALPTLAPMLKKVNPGVVNISTTTTREVNNPLLNDPFFKRFFNVPDNYRRQHKANSAGSGVIIDADKGIVVSNYHVIANADDIEVILNDGRSFTAKLLGSDPEVDIAVLKIKANDLVAVPMADSGEVEVGDFAIAIGNPFGLGQTVTSGLVSALGRSGLNIEGYEDFIQTDASINPGNSGGALVNLRGELIGINTAIIAPGGGNVGIGFAIPSNMAKVSIDQILEHGSVKRGQLGVFIQDLNPALAEAFNLKKQQKGVLLSKVMPGSSAAEGGLKAGDIIVAVNGKTVKTASSLRNAIGLLRIGDKVKLDVLREGKTKRFKIKLKEGSTGASAKRLLGKLEGAKLSNSPSGNGVVVSELMPGSPAARSGLRPGDVILEVNRQRINDLNGLRQAVQAGKGKLLLRINRQGAALFLVIH